MPRASVTDGEPLDRQRTPCRAQQASAGPKEPANGCQQYGRQLSHSAATGFDEPENPIGGYISDQAGAGGDPLWVDRDEDCPAPGQGTVLPGPPVDLLEDLPPNGPGAGPPMF